MDNFAKTAVELVPKIKNSIQLAALLIVAIAALIINLGSEFQVLPTTLLLATLIVVFIALNIPTRILPPSMLFVLYLVMLFVAISFVGVAAIMAMESPNPIDETKSYENEFEESIRPALNSLNAKVFRPNVEKIKGFSKAEFHDFLIGEVDRVQGRDEVVRVMDFYLRVLDCEKRDECRREAVSDLFDERFLQFHTYWPYILKLRNEGFAPDYGEDLLIRAKEVYRSS